MWFNLLAQNETKPILIVITDGHAFTGNPARVSAGLVSRNVDAFADDLLKDMLPLIEATYRVHANRESRAIVGLSMGGGQSLGIGPRHRESFA